MLSFEGLKGSRFRRPALTIKMLLGRSVPHCWHLSKSHRNFFRRGWIVMNAGAGEKKPVPVALMSLPPTSYPSLWWGRQAPARGSSRKYTLPNTSQKEKHHWPYCTYWHLFISEKRTQNLRTFAFTTIFFICRFLTWKLSIQALRISENRRIQEV